jgi:hypothetical protein
MSPTMIAAALLATTAAVAEAQTAGGPEIAYVKVGGTAQEIYLVNADGSGLKKLYTAGRKKSIGWLDLKPGGGEIAFVEGGSGSPRSIKILSYDDAGVPSGPARSLSGPCGPDTVDYHPTEPKLIISDICSQSPGIATIGTDGSGYSVVVSAAAYINKARWLKDGLSYVYVRAPVDGAPLQICRNACNPDKGELLRTVSGVWWMDVGRNANTILHDYAGSNTTEIDAMTGTVLRETIVVGNGAHYSSDDTRILYETPHSARGNFLHILNADGSTTRLTGKGEYGPTDWRQDLPPAPPATQICPDGSVILATETCPEPPAP